MRSWIFKTFCIVSYACTFSSLFLGNAFAGNSTLDSNRLQKAKLLQKEKLTQDLIQKIKELKVTVQKSEALLKDIQGNELDGLDGIVEAVESIEAMDVDVRRDYLQVLARNFKKLITDLREANQLMALDYRTNASSFIEKNSIAELINITAKVWRDPPNTMDWPAFEKKSKKLPSNEIIVHGALALTSLYLLASLFIALGSKFNIDLAGVEYLENISLILPGITHLVIPLVGGAIGSMLIIPHIFWKKHEQAKKLYDERQEFIPMFEPFYQELKDLGFKNIPQKYEDRLEWMHKEINLAVIQGRAQAQKKEALITTSSADPCQAELTKKNKIYDDENEADRELDAEEDLRESQSNNRYLK